MGIPQQGRMQAASPELIPNQGKRALYTMKSPLLGSHSSKCQLCLAPPSVREAIWTDKQTGRLGIEGLLEPLGKGGGGSLWGEDRAGLCFSEGLWVGSGKERLLRGGQGEDGPGRTPSWVPEHAHGQAPLVPAAGPGREPWSVYRAADRGTKDCHKPVLTPCIGPEQHPRGQG